MEHFPTETADDIADVIGCSDSTVSYKAKQLGLEFHKWNYIGRYVKRVVIKK